LCRHARVHLAQPTTPRAALRVVPTSIWEGRTAPDVKATATNQMMIAAQKEGAGGRA
jgi:hypothetical protein